MSKLTDIPIEEYTTPSPISLEPGADYQTIIDTMHDNDVRHVPVVEGDKPCGIISERDVLRASRKADTMSLQAKDVMTPNPFVVPVSATLGKVAFEISSRKIGSALVVDSNGGLYGIFTAIDGLNALVEVLRGEVD